MACPSSLDFARPVITVWLPRQVRREVEAVLLRTTVLLVHLLRLVLDSARQVIFAREEELIALHVRVAMIASMAPPLLAASVLGKSFQYKIL